MTLFFSKKVLLSLLFIITTISTQHIFADQKISKKTLVRLATTTSTDNSGLLKYLLPVFEKDTQYKVHVIAVGTGKALRMGRGGDVDILLVHALKAEQKFVADGYGEERYSVMYNDFVIVGPKEEANTFKKAKSIEDVLKKIASEKKRFVSRGDDSGTHKKEISLWRATKSIPNSNTDSWYLEAGQGMGKVLQIAGEMSAYTMTDRGTWLAFKNRLPLAIVFEGDSKLFNPYGIIAISPKKYPDINQQGAQALIDWITSEKGQRLIGEFKVSGKVLFTPTASSVASN